MMCQADDGNLGEDGVAPEGALHLSEGGEAKRYPFEPNWTLTPPEKLVVALTLALSRHAVECMRRAEFTDDELLAVSKDALEQLARRSDEEATSVADTKRYAAMEADETLSGYGQMFRDLMERGWSVHRSHAYVLTRATHDLYRQVEVLQSQLRERKRSPVPAANKSASLTPQNLEAKAREIVCGEPLCHGDDDVGRDHSHGCNVMTSHILHALREERERAAKIVDHLSRIFETPYTDPLPENNTPEAGMRMAADFAKIAAAAIRGDSNG